MHLMKHDIKTDSKRDCDGTTSDKYWVDIQLRLGDFDTRGIKQCTYTWVFAILDRRRR